MRTHLLADVMKQSGHSYEEWFADRVEESPRRRSGPQFKGSGISLIGVGMAVRDGHGTDHACRIYPELSEEDVYFAGYFVGAYE